MKRLLSTLLCFSLLGTHYVPFVSAQAEGSTSKTISIDNPILQIDTGGDIGSATLSNPSINVSETSLAVSVDGLSAFLSYATNESSLSARILRHPDPRWDDELASGSVQHESTPAIGVIKMTLNDLWRSESGHRPLWVYDSAGNKILDDARLYWKSADQALLEVLYADTALPSTLQTPALISIQGSQLVVTLTELAEVGQILTVNISKADGTEVQEVIEVVGAEDTSGTETETYQVIVDNTDANFSTSGTWTQSGLLGHTGSDTSLYEASNADASATWSNTVSADSTVDVEVYVPPHSSSTANALYNITHDGIILTTVTVDQRPGGWISLGQVQVIAGEISVTVHDDPNGVARADAARFTVTSQVEDDETTEDGTTIDTTIGHARIFMGSAIHGEVPGGRGRTFPTKIAVPEHESHFVITNISSSNYYNRQAHSFSHPGGTHEINIDVTVRDGNSVFVELYDKPDGTLLYKTWPHLEQLPFGEFEEGMLIDNPITTSVQAVKVSGNNVAVFSKFPFDKARVMLSGGGELSQKNIDSQGGNGGTISIVTMEPDYRAKTGMYEVILENRRNLAQRSSIPYHWDSATKQITIEDQYFWDIDSAFAGAVDAAENILLSVEAISNLNFAYSPQGDLEKKKLYIKSIFNLDKNSEELACIARPDIFPQCDPRYSHLDPISAVIAKVEDELAGETDPHYIQQERPRRQDNIFSLQSDYRNYAIIGVGAYEEAIGILLFEGIKGYANMMQSMEKGEAFTSFDFEYGFIPRWNTWAEVSVLGLGLPPKEDVRKEAKRLFMIERERPVAEINNLLAIAERDRREREAGGGDDDDPEVGMVELADGRFISVERLNDIQRKLVQCVYMDDQELEDLVQFRLKQVSNGGKTYSEILDEIYEEQTSCVPNDVISQVTLRKQLQERAFTYRNNVVAAHEAMKSFALEHPEAFLELTNIVRDDSVTAWEQVNEFFDSQDAEQFVGSVLFVALSENPGEISGDDNPIVIQDGDFEFILSEANEDEWLFVSKEKEYISSNDSSYLVAYAGQLIDLTAQDYKYQLHTFTDDEMFISLFGGTERFSGLQIEQLPPRMFIQLAFSHHANELPIICKIMPTVYESIWINFGVAIGPGTVEDCSTYEALYQQPRRIILDLLENPLPENDQDIKEFLERLEYIDSVLKDRNADIFLKLKLYNEKVSYAYAFFLYHSYANVMQIAIPETLHGFLQGIVIKKAIVGPPTIKLLDKIFGKESKTAKDIIMLLRLE
jgi:hypothetical protein